jgi:hypothetical protein
MTTLQNQTVTGSSYYPLVINSKDRVPGNPINNFPMPLTIPPSFKPRYINLCEAHFPQTWYVFNSSNNTVTFIESTAPTTQLFAVIPPGNYNTQDPTTIMTAVSTAMTSAGTQTYTVTFNFNTQLLTISAPGTFQILWSKTNDPSTQLGFPNVDSIVANTFTGTAPVKLSPSGCIYITLDGLNTTKIVTSSLNPAGGNFVCCIDALSGQLVRWTNNGIYRPSPITAISSMLTIKLTDANGLPLPLLTDYTMTFQLLESI